MLYSQLLLPPLLFLLVYLLQLLVSLLYCTVYKPYLKLLQLVVLKYPFLTALSGKLKIFLFIHVNAIVPGLNFLLPYLFDHIFVGDHLGRKVLNFSLLLDVFVLG